MGGKKKTVWNVLFLLLVFALTMYGVFYGEDIGAIGDAIQNADIRFLIPAVGCVVFFIWGESIIIYYLLGTMKYRLSKIKCFLISSIGFFFS